MDVRINDGGRAHDLGRFQIAARPGFLGCLVNAAVNAAGMDKMFAQMRDVFEEYNFVAKCDVVEQNKMLMKLAHVADMRHHGHAKFAAKQTDGDEFAHARNAHGVHLNESGASGLQIVFENDAVRHVFAQRQLRRRNRVSERFVARAHRRDASALQSKTD